MRFAKEYRVPKITEEDWKLLRFHSLRAELGDTDISWCEKTLEMFLETRDSPDELQSKIQHILGRPVSITKYVEHQKSISK